MMFLQKVWNHLSVRKAWRKTKDTYTLTYSIQDHQITGKIQVIDLTESLNFLSNKFEEYEEDVAIKDKITEDLRSEVDRLSTKVEKLAKFQDQQEHCSRRNLVHGIAEEKEEITNEVTINALNEKLDLAITLQDTEKKPVLLF